MSATMSRSRNTIQSSHDWWIWIIPLALAILLVTTSFYNFLLFHSLAELFAIGVAILMSVVAWQMYPFTRNHYLVYLGCGYFWIGALDLMHTLTFKGVGIFQGITSSEAIEFWIGTRYIEALILLSAPWFLTREHSSRIIFLVYGFIATLLTVLVMQGHFPVSFVEGQGLTGFKIYSEYLIVGLLVAAMALHWNKRELLEAGILKFMMASIALTICAEVTFTLYVEVSGVVLVVGHIFKLLSYWMIFVAMIQITLQQPFRAMARDASSYDAVPDATIVLDTEGVIRQINKAASKLSGLNQSQLLGRNCHEFFHPGNKNIDDCEICRLAEQGENVTGVELFDGERWFDYSLSTINDSHMIQGSVLAVRDISQRKKDEAELKNYRDHLEDIVKERTALLEASNKELESFSYTVSHDLRSPLRAISGFSQALMDDYQERLDEQGLNYLERVRSATKQMDNLIDDLLRLSRVSRLKLEKQRVNLSELAEQSVKRLRESDPDRNVEVTIQSDLEANGDEHLLQVVLDNLISNAWKYTCKQSSPKIEFGCNIENDEKVFYVKDNGMGFDMAYVDKLFNIFQRLHGNEIEGTGIGLVTVQRLVKRHGGKVWVIAAVDQGATFYFTL